MTTRRALEERMHALEQLLDKIDRSVERIEIVTVVREPGTTMAADAYEGLRKQVVAAAGERMAHLAQLAHFDAAVRSGATPNELAQLVKEWMTNASLMHVGDPRHDGSFEVVGDGDAARVLRPAYVDGVTGRVVRSGVIERYRAGELDELPGARPEAPAGVEEAPL